MVELLNDCTAAATIIDYINHIHKYTINISVVSNHLSNPFLHNDRSFAVAIAITILLLLLRCSDDALTSSAIEWISISKALFCGEHKLHANSSSSTTTQPISSTLDVLVETSHHGGPIAAVCVDSGCFWHCHGRIRCSRAEEDTGREGNAALLEHWGVVPPVACNGHVRTACRRQECEQQGTVSASWKPHDGRYDALFGESVHVVVGNRTNCIVGSDHSHWRSVSDWWMGCVGHVPVVLVCVCVCV